MKLFLLILFGIGSVWAQQQAEDCVIGEYFDATSQSCKKCLGECGIYQDEPGQTSCKYATLESCGPNRVPVFTDIFFPRAKTSLDEACQNVTKGKYYENVTTSSTCYPVKECRGCGMYQDEEKQTECKQITLNDCPIDSVPTFRRGATSPDQLCETVGVGKFYREQNGCYQVEECSGCGAYQPSNERQTQCLTATLTDCQTQLGTEYIPKMMGGFLSDPGISLESACQMVPPGSFYETTLNSCFSVKKCRGCGLFQDVGGQTECKSATLDDCPIDSVPAFIEGAISKDQACKKVGVGKVFENNENNCYPVTNCEKCGEYQPSQERVETCQVVQLEDCPAGHVPKTPSLLGQPLTKEDACKPVPKGYYYSNDASSCFPISACDGCGEYQDLEGQTTCKVVTKDQCPANSVPKKKEMFGEPLTSIEEACEEVPAGYFYKDDQASCYPVEICSGCGAYQPLPFQTECLFSTLESCGSTSVPREVSAFGNPVLTLEDACKVVSPGYAFTNSADECYKIKECKGCGVFSSLPKMEACEIATCEAGMVGKFNDNPVTTFNDACKPVPKGYFYTDISSDDIEEDCYPISICEGCGTYQDEVGQTSCKQTQCLDAGLQKLVAAAETELDACQKLPIPKGMFQEQQCAKVCAGCGSYQDEENQFSCKLATKESCPNKHYPKLSSGAKSLSEACDMTDIGGFGFNEEQCTFTSCQYPAAQAFSCDVLARNGHSNCTHVQIPQHNWKLISSETRQVKPVCELWSLPDDVRNINGCWCKGIEPTEIPTRSPTKNGETYSPTSSPTTKTPTQRPFAIEENESSPVLPVLGALFGFAALSAAVFGFFLYRRRQKEKLMTGKIVLMEGKMDKTDLESVFTSQASE